jgi:hypothetical protein
MEKFINTITNVVIVIFGFLFFDSVQLCFSLSVSFLLLSAVDLFSSVIILSHGIFVKKFI